MKAVQKNATQAQEREERVSTRSERATTRVDSTEISAPGSGSLAQLASAINQSSRMQPYLKLSEEMQNSGKVQKQQSLASTINQGVAEVLRPATQMKTGVSRNHDEDLDYEANVMGAKAVQMNRSGEAPAGGGEEGCASGDSRRSSVIQRYHDTGQGSVYGYGKGAGPHAPNFEFQKASVTRNYNAAASTVDYGVDIDQVFENAPAMRVSDNNDMAVPTAKGAESKQFYATPAKIQESNTLLHNSGSPLRLTQGAGQIRVSAGWNPLGPTLHEVTPDLTQIQLTNTECGVFAQEVLGAALNTAEVNTVGGPQNVAIPPNRGPRDTSINNALGTQSAEALGGDRNADPEVGEAFGIYARSALPAQTAWQRVVNGMWAVKDKILTTLPYLQWGEHWAGVVAKSGGDSVTMENYNRSTSITAMVEQAMQSDYPEFKALSRVNQFQQSTSVYATQGAENRIQRLARLGRRYLRYAAQIGQIGGHFGAGTGTWYFAMYGQGNQSFHETWKSALPNAVTLKTHSSDQNLKAQLVAKLNMLVPNDAYAPGTQATLLLHTGNVQNAAGRNQIIAAYVAGAVQVSLARLDSANNYEQTQAHDANALQTAWQAARQNVTNARGDAVSQACNAGIQAMQGT